MSFTLETVAASLAAHLAPVLPGVTFCKDPGQQGSQMPCMFLQQRCTQLRQHLGRWERRLGLDLTYLEDCGLTDLQQRYVRAAAVLDEAMALFPYRDGTTAVLLRTYEREWHIDLDALHYKFELRVFQTALEHFEPMQRMECHKEVRNGGKTIQP